MNKNILVALIFGVSFGGLFGMNKEVGDWRTFSYTPFGYEKKVKRFLIKTENDCFIKNGIYEKKDDTTQNVFVTEGQFEVIKEDKPEGVAYRLLHKYDNEGKYTETYIQASKNGFAILEDKKMQEALQSTLREFFTFVNAAKIVIEKNN